uniref:Uncharacterized protein n=1 Tax=Salix viminalis TaxID=40686 RepID=A0A6N2KVV7_SALVM
MDPTYALPDNVAILTLQELNDGKVLLRLAHLYEVGEDKDLSVMASVELKKVFPNKKNNRDKFIGQPRKSGNGEEEAGLESRRLFRRRT